MTLNVQLDLSQLEGLLQTFKNEMLQTFEAKLEEIRPTSKVGKDFMTPAEVKNQYGKSVPTLNKLVTAGVLTKHSFPGIRGVYYSRKQIEAVLGGNN